MFYVYTNQKQSLIKVSPALFAGGVAKKMLTQLALYASYTSSERTASGGVSFDLA